MIPDASQIHITRGFRCALMMGMAVIRVQPFEYQIKESSFRVERMSGNGRGLLAGFIESAAPGSWCRLFAALVDVEQRPLAR